MDKKLLLSKALTGAFAVFTVVLAVSGPILVDLVCAWYDVPRATLGNVLLISGYVCAALALGALFEIYGFLASISKGEVFASANIKHIRVISILCMVAGLVSLADCVATRIFFLGAVGFCALFMALLVCVVGDAFEMARRMKGELDLTI